MKFFSKYFIRPQHIEYIKRFRKKQYENKIIDYNNNYIEHYEYKKRVKLVDRDDIILKQLESLIISPIPFTKIILDDGTEIERTCNYIFESLPKELKAYMYQMDELFYNLEFKKFMDCDENEYYNILGSRYDRLKKVVDVDDLESFEIGEYLLGSKTIPSTDEKKARDSARRRYRGIREKVFSNIEDFENFITLTFASEENKVKHLKLNKERLNGEVDLKFNYIDISNYDKVVKAFTQFMNDFKKNLKKKYDVDLKYIVVPEEHKSGIVHYHMLTSYIPEEETYKIPQWLDKNYDKYENNKGIGLKYWKYGKSDFQQIQDKIRLANYICKYIVKNFLVYDEGHYKDYLGRKQYYASKNLDKAKVIYINDDYELQKTINEIVKDRDNVYQRKYANFYNMSIVTQNIYTNIEI